MYSIRRALPTDAAAIGALVRGLVRDSLIDPQGEEAQRFNQTLTADEVAKSIALKDRFHAVAEVNREVCGMIMVRDACHIGQFFVHPAQQGKGLGSALWQFALSQALASGGTGEFTVRSSVAAEPVYRRFGFEPTGPVEVQQGFRFIPMRRGRESAA
jgi:GNAT superfamily N-acetyltransferase